jgi:sulfite exporter TauE/SafE
MITEALTVTAAFLLGLAASGHCIVMCGGIAAALGVASGHGPAGAPKLTLVLSYQLGRVASYTIAGAVAGGALGSVVAVLDIESVRVALRSLSALALLLAAGVAFGRIRDQGLGIGGWLWPRIAPLGRRLLPVTDPGRALVFGMIWGWMPCGFVYSVVLTAALAADPVSSAATMIAFGLGTVPAMVTTGLGTPHLLRFAGHPAARIAAGTLLLACAGLTFAAPWLPPLHWQVGPGQEHHAH